MVRDHSRTEPLENGVQILRLTELTEAALLLVDEYYRAVDVIQRDSPEDLRRLILEPCSGIWLAYLNGIAVGCVLLRKLSSIPFAGECKRLYVQPAARGYGIAERLLDAQEEFARSQGLVWLYLDSYDDLKAALALYRKRGYTECDRYNANPQATVFLRKHIAS